MRALVILGLGIDVASIERIRHVLDRHGDRMWTRVLTNAEQAALGARRDRATALAGRWAAKEAAVKAFLGRAGALWHDFEVGRGLLGEPEMRFFGRAARVAKAIGVRRALVSITHDAGVAAAVVVLEGA
jgi:holo-[acyl-carrier protein] synthase